jgi:hypothetical protein
MYMDLSMSTGLEKYIYEGQPMDMCSRCLVEQSVG